MKLTHTGLSLHRLRDNPAEAALSKAWVTANNPPRHVNKGTGITELLMCSSGDGVVRRELTQAEATAAATVIQWLGSPVGMGFLRNVIDKCPQLKEGLRQ